MAPCLQRSQQHHYGTHPIVFVASLVDDKIPTVMRNANTSSVATTTVIRSAEGLGTLWCRPEDYFVTQEEYNAISSARRDSKRHRNRRCGRVSYKNN
jgi:hypothetical protein